MNRVHWLSPGDPGQLTGGYLYNARIASALRMQGVDVVVHTLDGPWPWPSASYEHVLDQVPDDAVVIADGLLWPGLNAGERQKICRRCTVWVVVHSLFEKEDTGNVEAMGAEMSALQEAYGWFATSQRTARLVNERLGGVPGSVVIPGTDVVAEPQIQNVQSNRLLNVAHLIPRKNQMALLDALASIKDLDWVLDIVGSMERDPDHAALVKERANELGLEDRIQFRGERSPAELETMYAQARCLIHTADFEAYGMVLSEALSRGLSVISTPAGALDGLDTSMAEMVDVGDIHGLAAAVRHVLDGPQNTAADRPHFPTWTDQAQVLTRVLGLHEEGFSVEWLRMREPYDHAARSIPLARSFGQAMGDGPCMIMEMASGLGSGTRFLNQHIERDIQWLLVDHDPQLLSALDKDMSGTSVQYQTKQHDLRSLDGLDVSVNGVTTQALLDLVSHDWLVQFADWLADRRIPFLGALSVDGRVVWSPEDHRDSDVQRAFRTHQTWDRGFGPSPGPQAAVVLKELLENRGFSVRLERADWEIPPADGSMLSAMVEGTAAAAGEAARDAGIDPETVSQWRDERMNVLGSLSVCVGHYDLLALP